MLSISRAPTDLLFCVRAVGALRSDTLRCAQSNRNRVFISFVSQASPVGSSVRRYAVYRLSFNVYVVCRTSYLRYDVSRKGRERTVHFLILCVAET